MFVFAILTTKNWVQNCLKITKSVVTFMEDEAYNDASNFNPMLIINATRSYCSRINILKCVA